MSACLAPQLRGQAFPLDWQGHVHSVFDHAVNITVCDGPHALPQPILLTLLDSPRNMGERCLVVPDFAFPPLRKPGLPVKAEQGRLIAAHSTLEFGACRVWKTTLVSGFMRFFRPRSLPLFSVAEVYRVAGLAQHPAPWGDTLYQRMAQWVAEDVAAQCADLTSLVGAGPGLTPAGDDMLVGWLCGRQILQVLSDRDGRGDRRDRDGRGIRDGRGDTAIRQALGALLHRSPSISTDISRAFLEDALNGFFCRPLARLGRIALAVAQSHATKAQQLAALHRAVNMAARFGASSGRDGAYGLLLALASDSFSTR